MANETHDPAAGTSPSPAPDAGATPPADAGGAPPAGGSLATGADPAAAPATPPQTWRDDWRQQIAGDDEKELKRLERYGSPSDLYTAYRNAETALSQARKQPGLPDDATDEQIAAYRKANGVPDAPDGYLNNLPNGMVLSAADRAIAGDYLERMHAKNMTPDAVQEGLVWYQETLARQQDAQQQMDLENRGAASQALSAEYGAEFKARMNSVKALLDTAPPLEDGTPMSSMLENARLPDGTLIGDSPAMIKFLADMAYRINPAGFVSPVGDGGQLDSVRTELAGLRAQMANPGSKYWKDPKLQERFRTLLGAEERLSA